MSDLAYLKNLTDSLCLRDKRVRLGYDVLSAIMHFCSDDITCIVLDKKSTVIMHEGSFMKEELKEGASIEDLFGDEVNFSKNVGDAINMALNGSDYAFSSNGIKIFSRPMVCHDSGSVVGSILITFKEKGV
ncbi:MAG: hypothetical protein CBE07_001525 [Pelagibacteraceae bacterium TMED247]|nr:MAG: hypothetical protein CBE07_001525 [Pelagibacteraceae bacterium TMED247]|tara:strand:+ start:5659 stop:6051 length:393 start_codon:yes stop_codon:yes gene_type:complete